MKNNRRFLSILTAISLTLSVFLCVGQNISFAQSKGFSGYVPPTVNNPSTQTGTQSGQPQTGMQPGQSQTGTQPGQIQTGTQPGQVQNGSSFGTLPQTANFGAVNNFSSPGAVSNTAQTNQNGQYPPDNSGLLDNSGEAEPRRNNLNDSFQNVPTTFDANSDRSGAAETNDASNSSKGRVVPPPTDFQLNEIDQIRLDEFLNHWENFGKGIKKISCNIQVKEFDGGLFQKDSKIPTSHTWGQFRFISPNKIQYHVRGNFSYSGFDEGKEPQWQESNNEWQFVYDGKSMTHYDFAKSTATVIPIVEAEWNQDLTLESPFPLFFVANAKNLKERFYMRLITKPEKAKTEVWIEAVPRYSEDAKSFKNIIVTLKLKNLQPYYMRKYGINGKSYTDFTFEDIAVNKGNWNIDANVNPTWTKKVEPEYSFKNSYAADPSTLESQNAANSNPPLNNGSNPNAIEPQNSGRVQENRNAAAPNSSFNPSLQRF